MNALSPIRTIAVATAGLVLVGSVLAAGFSKTAGSTSATASKADITKLQNQINTLKQQLDTLRAAVSVSGSRVTINKKLRVTSDVDIQGDLDVLGGAKVLRDIETAMVLKALSVQAKASIKRGSAEVVYPGHKVTGTVILPAVGIVQLINGRVN